MKTAILLLGITMSFLYNSYARPRYYNPPSLVRVVTNTNDSGEGSLRHAITSAFYGDTILLDPALNGQVIGLTTGEIIINKSVIIRGLNGNVTITRAVGTRFRIFNIQSGTVVISDVTISNGYADASYGGGILNRTNLTLLRCHITGNISDAGDGGGGIWNIGELTLESCTVDNNQAIHSFGFPTGYGGGIKSAGILNLVQSTVTENLAELQGGGIYCNGSLTITESTVSGNSAPEGANIYGCVFQRRK